MLGGERFGILVGGCGAEVEGEVRGYFVEGEGLGSGVIDEGVGGGGALGAGVEVVGFAVIFVIVAGNDEVAAMF